MKKESGVLSHMKTTLIFIAFCFATLRPTITHASSCPEDVRSEVLVQTFEGRSLSWSIQPATALFRTFSLHQNPERNYVRWVRSKTHWTPQQGIANSIRVRQEALRRSAGNSSSFRRQLEMDIRNLTKVLRGQVGTIRAVRCLEGLPFREFLQTANLRSHPQEFVALVLKKKTEIRILGDYYRRPRSAPVGVSSSASVRQEFHRLRNQGWSYFAHLHNHPYNFQNAYGDIGGNLIPSDPDVALYRQQLPEMALITDGIHVIEIPRRDFGKFELPR